MVFLRDYEKIELIGKGSFANIYKVKHLTLKYVRAIKVSNEMIDSEDDPAYQTFLNECKVLLKIGNGSHPNIVHLYQPRLIDNRAIVEMDYVDGETLAKYIERVKFVPIDEVHRFFKEIVGAMAYCHHDIYKFLMDPNEDDLTPDPNNGHRYIIDDATKRRLIEKYSVTHNDLHSNNVMRRSYDESFILLDFGLAIQDGNCVKSSSRNGGALEYMSPEKFNNQNIITKQSDVYSLGILLYEVLAGRVPFVLDPSLFSSNPTSAQYNMMTKQQHDTPPSIEALRREAFEKANPGQTYTKDYPNWMEEMILKCLEKKPADRYADAKELFDDYKAKCQSAPQREKVRFVPRNKPQTPPPPADPGQSATKPPTPTQPYKPKQSDELKGKKNGGSKLNKGLLAFIIIMLVALFTVLGILAYNSYQESQLPRYYNYASSLRLRATQDTIGKDNIIASLPYGTKLLMLDYGNGWSHVKAVTDDGKQEGWVSSDYILDENDFYLLDGIFGNNEAREQISQSGYRKALLKYYKRQNYRGFISDEAYKDLGIEPGSDNREMWQIFCGSKTSTSNSVYYCKEYNRYSKNKDMVVVLQNGNSNAMKLVYFYIDDDNKAYVVYEETAYSSRIRNVSVGTSWWTGEKTFSIDYE